MSNLPKGQVSQFFGSKIAAGGAGAGITSAEVQWVQLNTYQRLLSP